jgi:hypothetical protein
MEAEHLYAAPSHFTLPGREDLASWADLEVALGDLPGLPMEGQLHGPGRRSQQAHHHHIHTYIYTLIEVEVCMQHQVTVPYPGAKTLPLGRISR